MSIHYLVERECLKATIENKTSVTTYFKELTTGNVLLSQLVSKVTVTTCSFLYRIFNVSALLMDDVLLHKSTKSSFSVVVFKTLIFHKVLWDL